MKKRILHLDKADHLKKNLINKRIVLVGGCFDLLHYGHITFLTEAKRHGDMLVVALESDEFIVQHKRKAPIHNHMQRATMLTSLEVVDVVILLPLLAKDQDYLNLIQRIQPHTIAVTEGDPNLHKKQQHADQVQANLEVVTSRVQPFSTSSILYETISRH